MERKETIILIKNINNFDKNSLLEIVKKTIKMRKSSTVRGKVSLRRLNEAIAAGRPYNGGENETFSLFGLFNYNGWLAYTLYNDGDFDWRGGRKHPDYVL